MRTALATFLAMIVAIASLVAVFAAEPAATSGRKPTASAPRAAASAATKLNARTVSVHVYNKEGELVGPVESPKVILSAAQWRRRLSAEQYKVLRAKDTEAPFCGDLLDNKKEGVYSCAGCGLPLFSSASKFNSGTGWPSFFQPVDEENIETHPDFTEGLPRLEVKCVRCKGHLGHVFDDGPPPTQMRFCLNSASLKFTDAEHLADLADPAADSNANTKSGAAAEVGADAAVTSEAGVRGGKNTATETSTGGKRAAQPGAGNDSATSGGGDGPTARAPRATATQTKEKGVTESDKTATAVFAGGCFWCTEAAFQQLRGVSDVESGYAGGTEATATYEQVSTGRTGHAEAIRVTYDPAKITYDQLLMVFFDAHDPTQLNRQGPDIGKQYRSAIFFADDEQKKAAEAKIHDLTEHKAYGPRRVVTKLEPLVKFFPAELYHQDYVLHNPLQPYVQGHSVPKACSIQKRHPELIDPEKAVKPVGY